MIKQVKMQKQLIEKTKDFSRLLENKIESKLQSVIKEKRISPNIIKHPKSGKGL